jgi:hypothetical protein
MEDRPHDPQGDERRRKGRLRGLYVVFPSALVWKTRAVNYIWAYRLPRGEFLPNAYTGSAVMVAVESGENAGRWIDEERNLVEDYRRPSGHPPDRRGTS